MKQGNKIVLLIGIIALLAGSFVLSRELSFRKNAVQTRGVVISTLGSAFDVQYIISDGTETAKRFTAKVNHNRAGDPKNVWYLPEKSYSLRNYSMTASENMAFRKNVAGLAEWFR